jgi:hypothetical protein
MRNEEEGAAGRLQPYYNWEVTFTHLPVIFVSERSRSFKPTGRCNCARSPARKSIERRGRRKEEEKVR